MALTSRQRSILKIKKKTYCPNILVLSRDPFPYEALKF
jgi:hypothetical protein